MTRRASAAVAAFFGVAVLSAGMVACAADMGISPDDFGLVPAPTPYQVTPYQNAIAPLAPAGAQFVPVAPAVAAAQPGGEPTGDFLPGAPAPVMPLMPVAPAAPVMPAMPAAGLDAVTGATPSGMYSATVVPAPLSGAYPAADSLQAAAPDLYASLTATVTATTGDPSIPVVVRPATTAQALDAAGAPVNLAGIAAAGNPTVDWNAARAGTPYPVETPGQPGVMTYVVPIQVPVYVGADAAQTAPVARQDLSAQPARQMQQQQVLPPQAVPFVSFVPSGTAAVPAPQTADPFANIIAITPGATPVVPTATAGVAGAGGVFYYGTNPVSIASALGMETADGTEYTDFNALSSGAINLVTAAQIKQALARQTPLVIIDVRGDLVREIEGHVPGDINIPFDTPETFAARVAAAVPDRALPVVVYCQDGIWSSHAADVLLAMGYKTFLMGSYRLW